MRPPAFQFYADDFSAGTCDLSPEEVGAYIRLLCYQWSRGEIPADPVKIARIAGCEPTPDVLAKFPARRNARMESERAKQDKYRAKQSGNGRSGAGKRWHGTAMAPPMAPPSKRHGTANGTAIETPMANGMARNSSPSPSPSPSPITLPSPLSNTEGASAPVAALPFASAEFVQAWADFEQHRRELKKKLTPTATKQIFADFAKWGEPRAIAAILHTIGKGWQGIREPEHRGGTPPPAGRSEFAGRF